MKQRKNLTSKECPECGHKFSISDLVPPLKNFEMTFGYKEPNGFYGGQVKKYTKAECKCGAKFILYWSRNKNGYWVKDIEMTEKPAKKVEKKKEPQKPENKEKTKELPLIGKEDFLALKLPERKAYLKVKFGCTAPKNASAKSVSELYARECQKLFDKESNKE